MTYNEFERTWNLIQPYNKFFYFIVSRVQVMTKDKESYFTYIIKALKPKKKPKILNSYFEDVIPFIDKIEKEIKKGKICVEKEAVRRELQKGLPENQY